MFAIVEVAGKQYSVQVGDVLELTYAPEEIGKTITLEKVLLVGDEKSTKVGTPTVAGAKVEAKILSQAKGEKIEVRRYKQKVRYRKHRGFRPLLTKLEIVSVQ